MYIIYIICLWNFLNGQWLPTWRGSYIYTRNEKIYNDVVAETQCLFIYISYIIIYNNGYNIRCMCRLV